jgi:hypothetical protein
VGRNKVRCGSLLFLLYINDLPKIVNDNAEIVPYTEDTSIIIISLNPIDFTNNANKIFQDVNKWFTTNMLSLNADKTQYMQFLTKASSLIDLNVMYKNKEISETSNTKYLRLTLNNTFSWKNIPRISEDGILLLLSLHTVLWISILGQFLS